MKGEVLSTVFGSVYAEAVGRGSGGSRGASLLYGGGLAAWAEGGVRREALLDVLLDRCGAGLVYGALKRLEDGTRFGLLFDVLTNAEVRAGVGGRIRICGGGFGCVAEGA